MKGYRFCKVKHEPPESYGDCMKACIDTILDRDDTPHVFDDRPGEEAWSIMREWLASIGYSPFITCFPGELSLEEFFEQIKVNNPNAVFMLLARTNTGEDHAVICENAEVVHNPAWVRQPIERPHSMGVWVVVVLGKI